MKTSQAKRPLLRLPGRPKCLRRHGQGWGVASAPEIAPPDYPSQPVGGLRCRRCRPYTESRTDADRTDGGLRLLHEVDQDRRPPTCCKSEEAAQYQGSGFLILESWGSFNVYRLIAFAL